MFGTICCAKCGLHNPEVTCVACCREGRFDPHPVVQLAFLSVACNQLLLAAEQAVVLMSMFDASRAPVLALRAAELLLVACADPLDFWLDVLPQVYAGGRAELHSMWQVLGTFNIANATGRCVSLWLLQQLSLAIPLH